MPGTGTGHLSSGSTAPVVGAFVKNFICCCKNVKFLFVSGSLKMVVVVLLSHEILSFDSLLERE